MINLTSIYPGYGLNIWATSLLLVSRGIPLIYNVFVAFSGTLKDSGIG